MTTPLLFSAEGWNDATELVLPEGPSAETVATLGFPGVGFADLGRCFDTGFTRLAALGPTGPWYGHYVGEVGPDSTFDLTIGFAVAPGTRAPEGITVTTFPAGPVRALTHRGPYATMPATWERLLAAPGRPARRGILEIYVTDPSVTPEPDLRTDLLLLL